MSFRCISFSVIETKFFILGESFCQKSDGDVYFKGIYRKSVNICKFMLFIYVCVYLSKKYMLYKTWSKLSQSFGFWDAIQSF